MARPRERSVNRERVEHRTPEPDEHTSYKEATTVTCDENPPIGSPSQETGTMTPRCDE
jgi:hypothetical protein